MYNHFDDSSGQIWLDDVRCTGTETDIDGCSHSDWGVHDCLHREDVAVSCYPWTDRNGMFSESWTDAFRIGLLSAKDNTMPPEQSSQTAR